MVVPDRRRRRLAPRDPLEGVLAVSLQVGVLRVGNRHREQPGHLLCCEVELIQGLSP